MRNGSCLPPLGCPGSCNAASRGSCGPSACASTLHSPRSPSPATVRIGCPPQVHEAARRPSAIADAESAITVRSGCAIQRRSCAARAASVASSVASPPQRKMLPCVGSDAPGLSRWTVQSRAPRSEARVVACRSSRDASEASVSGAGASASQSSASGHASARMPSPPPERISRATL